MSMPDKYGNRYWCVKKPLSSNGEIYVYADKAVISQSGDLTLVSIRGEQDSEVINLSIARGQWHAFFAASQSDGSAVAVELWEGEIDRG